jgi:uncharacterized protein YecA (UPF0149 family)
MAKEPPESPSGYYHVIIPETAFGEEEFDDEGVIYRPISEVEAKSLTKRLQEVGRNQPCPCGSGIKYKKCCLRNSH